MNLSQLWQVILMILGAGAAMENLPVGGELHTKDVGLPPVFVSWRDGRRFEVDLRIKRTT